MVGVCVKNKNVQKRTSDMSKNDYADVTSTNDDEKKKEAHKNVGEEIVN